jgi:hypothetical protein
MKIFNRYILSVIVFVFAFVIYILTAAPNLMFTDCGELAGVCTGLGIAHPTGYPLFSIMGFLWTKLPLPLSKIQSLNIFASFLTALSALVFYHLCYLVIEYLSKKEIIKPKSKKPQRVQYKKASGFGKLWSGELDKTAISLISFAIALMYAFAGTVWSQALSIEVYSLQALLINLILFTFLKAITKNDSKYFMISAFLLGLSFSNHMTTLLVLPAIFFMYFKKPGEKFDFSRERWKILLMLFIPFIIGLSFYIYMPLRAASLPEFNWGGVSRSWSKFYYHVSARQYQVWMFSNWDFVQKNFMIFLKELPYQLGFVGIITFFIGIYTTYRLSRELFWFLIFLIIFNLVYTLNYSIHDIDTYFLSAFISFILVSGIGLLAIAKKYRSFIPLFFAIPLISIIINYESSNESDNLLVPEYTKILVNELKPNAIIISSQWDYFCSAFWYMQRIEGYRRDVVLIDKELCRRTWYLVQFALWYPEVAKTSEKEIKSFNEELELFESGEPYDRMLIQDRYIAMFNSIIDKNYDKMPVYITMDILNTDPDIGKKYDKIPQGFALRLVKGKEIYPDTLNPDKLKVFIASLRGSEGFFVDGIRTTAANNVAYLGRYALLTHRFEDAEKDFLLALRIEPNNDIALQGLRQLGK